MAATIKGLRINYCEVVWEAWYAPTPKTLWCLLCGDFEAYILKLHPIALQLAIVSIFQM